MTIDRELAIRNLRSGPDGVLWWNLMRALEHRAPIDLSGAEFDAQDLRCVDFSRVDLIGADLRNSNLQYADFTGADLSYSKLTGAQHTSPYMFRRARLMGAELPHSLDYGPLLKEIADASISLRTSFAALLLSCAFCVLTLTSLVDASLLVETPIVRLPVVQVEIPVSLALYILPAALTVFSIAMCVFLYWHFLRLKALPESLPSGFWTRDLVYLWLPNQVLLDSHHPAGLLERVRDRVSFIIVFSVLTLAVPSTLFMFLIESLRLQDDSLIFFVVTLFSIVLFYSVPTIVDSWFGPLLSTPKFYRRLPATFLGLMVVHFLSVSYITIPPMAQLTHMMLPAFLSQYYVSGVLQQHESGQALLPILGFLDIPESSIVPSLLFQRFDPGGPSKNHLKILGYLHQIEGPDRRAELRELIDVHGGTASIDLDLDNKSLKFIQIIGSDLGRVSMSGCDLRGVSIEKSVLSHSRIDDSDARLAYISSCDLTYTSFDNSNFDRAAFLGVDLTSASFSNTSLVGTIFVDCTLEKASFFNADLTGAMFVASKELRGSALECALNEDWAIILSTDEVPESGRRDPEEIVQAVSSAWKRCTEAGSFENWGEVIRQAYSGEDLRSIRGGSTVTAPPSGR